MVYCLSKTQASHFSCYGNEWSSLHFFSVKATMTMESRGLVTELSFSQSEISRELPKKLCYHCSSLLPLHHQQQLFIGFSITTETLLTQFFKLLETRFFSNLHFLILPFKLLADTYRHLPYKPLLPTTSREKMCGEKGLVLILYC